MLLLFIVYSNAVDDEMVEILKASSAGYTKFTDVQGEGSKEPHLGTHIWPDINNCIMAAIENKNKDKIVKAVNELKEKFPSVGISIFVTQLKEMI
jgi:nitrogen regulatory protein PII